jgi:hypothetical protein
MASTGTAPAPTARQLATMRRLADLTGTTFSHPKTRREASRQIAALLRRPISDATDVALDLAAVRGGTPEVI